MSKAEEYYQEHKEEILPQLEGFTPREIAEGAFESHTDLFEYILNLLDIKYDESNA